MGQKKVFIIGLLSGIAICIAILLVMSFIHVGKDALITSEHRNELIQLGVEAAGQKEVPVASLLIYGNEIIGEGRNSVTADTNVAAHAEINAVNAAIRKLGFSRFKLLNHDSLTLITTFEPCPMCEGALAENNIKRIVIVQRKSLAYKLKEWKRGFLLERDKRYVRGDLLQDSLFRLFPGIDERSIHY